MPRGQVRGPRNSHHFSRLSIRFAKKQRRVSQLGQTRASAHQSWSSLDIQPTNQCHDVCGNQCQSGKNGHCCFRSCWPRLPWKTWAKKQNTLSKNDAKVTANFNVSPTICGSLKSKCSWFVSYLKVLAPKLPWKKWILKRRSSPQWILLGSSGIAQTTQIHLRSSTNPQFTQFAIRQSEFQVYSKHCLFGFQDPQSPTQILDEEW